MPEEFSRFLCCFPRLEKLSLELWSENYGGFRLYQISSSSLVDLDISQVAETWKMHFSIAAVVMQWLMKKLFLMLLSAGACTLTSSTPRSWRRTGCLECSPNGRSTIPTSWSTPRACTGCWLPARRTWRPWTTSTFRPTGRTLSTPISSNSFLKFVSAGLTSGLRLKVRCPCSLVFVSKRLRTRRNWRDKLLAFDTCTTTLPMVLMWYASLFFSSDQVFGWFRSLSSSKYFGAWYFLFHRFIRALFSRKCIVSTAHIFLFCGSFVRGSKLRSSKCFLRSRASISFASCRSVGRSKRFYSRSSGMQNTFWRFRSVQKQLQHYCRVQCTFLSISLCSSCRGKWQMVVLVERWWCLWLFHFPTFTWCLGWIN